MAEFRIRDQVEVHDERLGNGSFGKVCFGEWKGATVAVRAIECQALNMPPSKSASFVAMLFGALDEVKFLSHANILQIYGIYCPTDSQPMVLMEFMHQTLRQRLLEGPELSRISRLYLLRSVACGLRYIHELPSPVIHKCLSSSCIFLSWHSPEVKIGDVGMAAVRGFCASSTGATRLRTAHYTCLLSM